MADKEVKEYLYGEYAEALKSSPFWVRMAFKTFLQRANRFVLTTPFLYFLLGKGTPDFKMSPKTVNYGLSEVSGQKCGNCIFAYKNIVKNKNICSQVRGDINPSMWCRLWKGENDEK